MHFICGSVSVAHPLGNCMEGADLDVWEVCPHNTIHHTPYVCDRILVLDLDSQLLPNEAPSAFATEQILRAHRLFLIPINMR